MPKRAKSRREVPRPRTQLEVNDLCTTALRTWCQAPGSARMVWFRWRGAWFYATHTSLRLIVRTPEGATVAYMYD